MRIIFATTNEGKMKEIREILGDLGLQILSLKEAGIDVMVDENGSTFEENALIKAREIAKLCPNDLILADDSGLEIDALNKDISDVEEKMNSLGSNVTGSQVADAAMS